MRENVLRNLQLAVTYDCQYNCFFCAANNLKKDIKTLNIEQIARITKEAKRLGCINVNITGGEPLLHKDLAQIVKTIYRNGLMVGLISNGALAEAGLLKRLKSSGLTEIAISIYGDEEYHDNFTNVKGSYRKALESIAIAKKSGLNVVINTIITHKSFKSRNIEVIKKIAKFHNILIQPILICLQNNKHLSDRAVSLNEVDLKEFGIFLQNAFVKPLHRNYFGSCCPAGNEYIYVGAYGDIFMCDLVQVNFGNVLEESLDAIWQRMIKKRKEITCDYMCIGLKNNI